MSTYTNILLHLVFSTKDRLPVIRPTFREQLYAYLGGAVQGNGGIPYQIGGTTDHVHILLRWVATESVSDLLREIKSGSSKWVKGTFPTERAFNWQSGYGAFSVSHSQKDRVAAYVRNQEQHHRKRSFQDEFRHMLHQHQIDFDERYIWD